MKKLNIDNEGLTGYYLEEKFVDNHEQRGSTIRGCEESGLVFIQEDETGENPGKIELHYKDESDLENKLSYIIMMLTDK